jgi:hypothetical protein
VWSRIFWCYWPLILWNQRRRSSYSWHYFILFIIDHISVLINSFSHIFMFFRIFSAIHMHLYELLYITVKEGFYNEFSYTSLLSAENWSETSHLCNKLCCA